MKRMMMVAAAMSIAVNGMCGTAAVEKATELIKVFEGFRPSVYKCAAGVNTIGYGSTDRRMVAKRIVSECEASAELKRVCEDIDARLCKEIGSVNSLKGNEGAAVISFIYNVGWANFKKSKMCRLLKEGKRGAVIGVEFRRWVYVRKGGKKKVCKGLAMRRANEAVAFLCGC